MTEEYIDKILEELGNMSGCAAINGFTEEAEFYSRVIRLIREINKEKTEAIQSIETIMGTQKFCALCNNMECKNSSYVACKPIWNKMKL